MPTLVHSTLLRLPGNPMLQEHKIYFMYDVAQTQSSYPCHTHRINLQQIKLLNSYKPWRLKQLYLSKMLDKQN